GEPTFLLEAHRMVGNILYFLGEFPTALRHFEQGIALYDRQQHDTLAFLSGQDPGVVCLSFAAWGLWMLGYSDQARTRSEEAVALARKLGHLNTLGLALSFAADLYNTCSNWAEAREYGQAVVRLAEEQGLPFSRAIGLCNMGYTLASVGQYENGI